MNFWEPTKASCDSREDEFEESDVRGSERSFSLSLSLSHKYIHTHTHTHTHTHFTFYHHHHHHHQHHYHHFRYRPITTSEQVPSSPASAPAPVAAVDTPLFVAPRETKILSYYSPTAGSYPPCIRLRSR